MTHNPHIRYVKTEDTDQKGQAPGKPKEGAMKWTVTKVLPINVATCWQAKYEAEKLCGNRPFYLTSVKTKEYGPTKLIWHIWCDELSEHTILAPTCIYDKVRDKYIISDDQRAKTRERYARWNSNDASWDSIIANNWSW